MKSVFVAPFAVLHHFDTFSRILLTLACTECKRRNYRTNKNKKNTTERIEMMKYCKWCHKHTLHKETK